MLQMKTVLRTNEKVMNETRNGHVTKKQTQVVQGIVYVAFEIETVNQKGQREKGYYATHMRPNERHPHRNIEISDAVMVNYYNHSITDITKFI